MAIFRNEPDEFQRLDWLLLQSGAVTLYFRPQVLAEDVEWLKQNHYRVDTFDCSVWLSVSEMHEGLSCGLEFPDYYGCNLNALNDCLADLEVSEAGGRVVVFNRYDSFAARFSEIAWSILDIMEINSRRLLLFGRRLIVLVQSDDPETSFERVGGRSVMWNPREWLNSSRGL
jgi:RNAse (barnase) inhibitor barstar